MTITSSRGLGFVVLFLLAAIAAMAGCSSSSSSGGDAGSATTDAGGSTKDDSGSTATGFACSETQGQCQCFDPPPSNAYAQPTCTGTYLCCFTQTVGTTPECECTNDDPCTLPTGAVKAASCP